MLRARGLLKAGIQLGMVELSPLLASRKGRGHSGGQGDLEEQQPLCPPIPTSLLHSSRYQRGDQLGKEWIYSPSETTVPFSVGRISLGSGRRRYILGPRYPQGCSISYTPQGTGSEFTHCKVKSALPTPDILVVVSKDEEGFQFCDFSTNNMDFS